MSVACTFPKFQVPNLKSFILTTSDLRGRGGREGREREREGDGGRELKRGRRRYDWEIKRREREIEAQLENRHYFVLTTF